MLRTAILAASLLFAYAPAAHAGSSPYSAPHKAALSDASVAPAVARALRPGASVTYTRACPYSGRNGRVLTEVSAYRANGRALGPQHRHYWNGPTSPYVDAWHGRKGSVTFDGITFYNGTRERVIVAGWCS